MPKISEYPTHSNPPYSANTVIEYSGENYKVPLGILLPPTNTLINGGFDFAQRQTPATLTTISDNAYGPDRWRITRENASVQYQRNDGTGETGITSMYYGTFKKITNAGKIHICQVVEGINSIPLRGSTVVFQVSMKASSAMTIRMAVLELQNAGTIDTIPATLVTGFGGSGVDPTLGANVAVITAAESKSVTTSWQTFYVSVTIPSNSKNIICAIWSNSQVGVNETLSMAQAGLYPGNASLPWKPRMTQQELSLCQRYTVVYGISGVAYESIAPGMCWSTTKADILVALPVTTRIVPAISFTSAANFGVLNSAGSAVALTALSVVATQASSKICHLLATVAAGLTGGNGTYLCKNNNTTDALIFSAEL